MSYLLYNAALACAAPWARRWLRSHPRHAPLALRFAPPVPPLDGRPIWVHACSVGEVMIALPLLEALRDRFPGVPLALSVSTTAGHALASERLKDTASLLWMPFDLRRSVRDFVAALRPLALLLVETELWPNVMREADRAGAAVLLVNGRLSDKHFARYWRFRAVLGPMLAHLAAAGMQSPLYAERLARLGVDPPRVRVTGNLKYDAVRTAVDAQSRARLRAECGLDPAASVLLFGSTRPGDEALASACWSTLRDEFPALRLIIVPRHVERTDEICRLFGEPLIRRSELRAGRSPAGERVLIVDTIGELGLFYAVATVAVVGGSFYPGVNGHNPLEPAALGAPVVFGPYMSNFEEPARLLVECRGAVRVDCTEDLYGALSALLAHPAEQRQMGTRARKSVLDGQGATARTLDLLGEVLCARGALER